ncbi:hypothetical protein NDN08_000696 [Rhodosorus marinus]|uniref:BZIP domain-containing protein n=1 Tax=Rhodosorus marinus TaxID=101924 RepID=A0AAV8UNZ0_9RHOD|nr:hypothetical protein NDN08_000696 [Rhodosorus marinus]
MMFENYSKQGDLEVDLKELSDSFPSLEPIEEGPYMNVEDNELLFPDELFKVSFEENNPYSLPSSTTAASSEARPAVKAANLKVSAAVESTPVVENMTATEHSWDDSGDDAAQPLPKGSSSGRYAIESAKKKAQQAATASSQQRDRKRAAEEGVNEEQSSDGKRQKTESSKHEERLKKNRKTAYISRIRRRVYTKELEAALLKSENVRDEVQKQNGDLKDELAKLRAEVAGLREQVSVSGGSPAPSTLPSESDPEEIQKGTGLDIGPVFLSEVFQGLITPITPRPAVADTGAGGGNMRVMFMFVLLFGLFLPFMDVHPSAPNRLPVELSWGSPYSSEKLPTGDVWDPASVIKNEPYLPPNDKMNDKKNIKLEDRGGAGPSSSTASASSVSAHVRSEERRLEAVDTDSSSDVKSKEVEITEDVARDVARDQAAGSSTCTQSAKGHGSSSNNPGATAVATIEQVKEPVVLA